MQRAAAAVPAARRPPAGPSRPTCTRTPQHAHTPLTPLTPQWEAIPDIGDYTVKKAKLNDRFTPVPDSLLAGAAVRALATGVEPCGWAVRRACMAWPGPPPGCAGSRARETAHPRPLPTPLLVQARDATASAIDARGGLETPMGGVTTDLTAIGAGRNTVVQVRQGAAGGGWLGGGKRGAAPLPAAVAARSLPPLALLPPSLITCLPL